ncbi:hypothetical protein VNO77_20046 [Canavalia gladiata]|uniref:O-fucosyltransferase family protein n=1 Tax=Canavalia gladiata TaxID=3824 RepID=A0AAN9LTS3_CANGL
MLSRRKPLQRFPLIPVSVLIMFLSFLFLYLYYQKSDSQFPELSKTSTIYASQCSHQALALGEKFMWYAPHSGFSNQLSEFKNAVVMAGILNRTLVVPPILDHHAVALGSCPKFRVVDPKDIRISVWDHVIELIRSGRYISIAEIVDVSSLVSSSIVRVIDLRDFVSIWCDVSLDLACLNDTKLQPTVSKSLKQCGSLLAGIHGSVENCIYAINEDCRTTVWTYHEDGHEDGMLDSFQPDEQLRQKKKISYIRRRKDVFKTLGPGSEVEPSSLLAFGSLFSAPYKGSELYVDLHESHQDQRFLSLMEKIQFLPFVPEIVMAGKEFAKATIKAPFLCAQLRLLDGQFKNHQKATFHGLKQRIESLRQKGPTPIHIFVMTDLPRDNWRDTYLGDLISDTHNYKVYFLREDDELLRQAAIKLMAAGHGQRFITNSDNTIGKKYCSNQRLPDLLLYVEQTVCICASLGFVGTPGSTIAENIELLRKFSSRDTHSTVKTIVLILVPYNTWSSIADAGNSSTSLSVSTSNVSKQILFLTSRYETHVLRSGSSWQKMTVNTVIEEIAKDATTPISKAFSLDLDATLRLKTSNSIRIMDHSRVPVYAGDKTNIIRLMVDAKAVALLKRMLTRKILHVSENMPLNDILNESQKSHIALMELITKSAHCISCICCKLLNQLLCSLNRSNSLILCLDEEI